MCIWVLKMFDFLNSKTQLSSWKHVFIKSVGKTFPLQGNTSQNYWSPWASQQNICNRCNQVSNETSAEVIF